MLSTEKIIEIANQYGTPIYILDKEHLGKRIHDIQTIFCLLYTSDAADE